MKTPLVYLSCPYGGDPANLHRAIVHLAWAHEHSPWGLFVQAPWIASAMAEAQRGTTEERGRAMGGILVEERVLDGYDALLHIGGAQLPDGCSAGMIREARYMVERGKPIYQRIGGSIMETTEYWEWAVSAERARVNAAEYQEKADAQMAILLERLVVQS